MYVIQHDKKHSNKGCQDTMLCLGADERHQSLSFCVAQLCLYSRLSCNVLALFAHWDVVSGFHSTIVLGGMVGGSEGCDVEAAIAAMEAPGPALEKLEEGLLEGDAEAVLRKKRLLFRTVYLAHKFGNPSYMTEVVGRQVGSCLGLSISLTMFPTTAMISFHEKSAVMHHTVTESYSFAVEQGLHAHSLTELTRLIAALRKGLVNLDEMEHQIARLERPRPIYSWQTSPSCPLVGLLLNFSYSVSLQVFHAAGLHAGRRH